MKREIGLWIDHRETVMVTLDGDKEDIKHIDSDVEKRVRYSGDSETRVTGDFHKDRAEDIRDRRFEGQLDHYYDAIIAELGEATAVLIMGPGEAKTEFHKHMEKHLPLTKIVNVESADKMTDAQIVAKVRRNFELYEFTH